jgi:hypothetical protein
MLAGTKTSPDKLTVDADDSYVSYVETNIDNEDENRLILSLSVVFIMLNEDE